MKNYVALSLIFVFVLFAGCSAPVTQTLAPPTQLPADATAPLPTASTGALPSSPSPLPLSTQTGSALTDTPVSLGANSQATPALSATPDTRLPPEDWQDWPVVPQATGRARQIYQQGLAQGVDPHAFSKIGDCQSIKEALMGMFDQPGRYQLPADQAAALQETINQFAGSFNRDGMAVKGGFNAASVLSPMWADPTCQAGETPLECEVRVHRPSFVIISLEVWWQGRTTQRYIDYMRKIIDYTIAHGAVPILSTKADNVEGDNSINLANAQLAYEYDLPLWNFWRAVQPLPYHGMDPVRNDGFHISQTLAWPVRSLTALQALDLVWRAFPAAVQRLPFKARDACIHPDPHAARSIHHPPARCPHARIAGRQAGLYRRAALKQPDQLPGHLRFRPPDFPAHAGDWGGFQAASRRGGRAGAAGQPCRRPVPGAPGRLQPDPADAHLLFRPASRAPPGWRMAAPWQ